MRARLSGWTTLDKLFERIKRCAIKKRIFWTLKKVCPRLPTHSNAYVNVSKWVFDFGFPWNHGYFGIIRNDFSSSRNWVIQIDYRLSEVENPEIPGIQPKNKPYNKVIMIIISNNKIFLFQYKLIWIGSIWIFHQWGVFDFRTFNASDDTLSRHKWLWNIRKWF